MSDLGSAPDQRAVGMRGSDRCVCGDSFAVHKNPAHACDAGRFTPLKDAEDARVEHWPPRTSRSFWERTIAHGASLYADSGGDVDRCEICDELLDDSEPWKRGLDGAGAHIACLRDAGVLVSA